MMIRQIKQISNNLMKSRRSVAPVIATLLMVAIAVVGGMLVFVFAQDFFTSTDTMTGPTIEVLHLYGYDARDVANSLLENHAGNACTVKNTATGVLANDDVFAVYVRNLGSQDVILGDVSVFNVKGTAGANAVLSITVPTGPNWVVNNVDACGTTSSGSGLSVKAGRDATILIAYDTGVFGDEVKIGRPIFVKVETGGGNIFTKQLVNGRQVG